MTPPRDLLAPHVPDASYAVEGRIPFRVRIGVTGHRSLEDEGEVTTRVAAALRDIRAVFSVPSATPVRFTVLSALAEGADRLVVHEAFTVLGDEVRVEAVLPREADDYMEDFGSAASRNEFEELLARASARPMPPAGSATEGYELAGRYVVDQSDVLVAVWDGRPARGRGGTAEVVSYARRRGRAVVLVAAGADEGAPAPIDPASPGLHQVLASLRRLEHYNAGSLDDVAFRRTHVHERARLARRLEGSPIRADVERMAAWALPRYVRAEVRALQFQRSYRALGDLLYLLAALAVTAVAAQSVFVPGDRTLVGVEIVCLLLVIAVFFAARRWHVHERWMSYRSLAEAFRSAPFIALTGAGERSGQPGAADTRDTHESWYQRAFSESWSLRPAAGDAAGDEPALRQLLIDGWLDDQIAYHRENERRCHLRHRRIGLTVAVLAGAALVVAVLHFLEVGGEDTLWPKWFTFLAIALPGFGAAVTGIREHRQFRLHGTRSGRTADRLERVKDRIQTRTRDKPARALAAEIQSIILQESVEWSGVQEFQDLEMVT